MNNDNEAPLPPAVTIRAALARAGTALDALHREVAAVMGEHSDEAHECIALHNQCRNWIAREAGHALKRLGEL